MLIPSLIVGAGQGERMRYTRPSVEARFPGMNAKSDSAMEHYRKNVPEKEKKALEQKEHAEHRIGPERERAQREAAAKTPR